MKLESILIYIIFPLAVAVGLILLFTYGAQQIGWNVPFPNPFS